MPAIQHADSPQLAEPGFDRIWRDPQIWGGKAVIANTRLPVFMVVARSRSGWSIERMIEEYPYLSQEDVHAALQYDHMHPALVEQDIQAYERSLLTPVG